MQNVLGSIIFQHVRWWKLIFLSLLIFPPHSEVYRQILLWKRVTMFDVQLIEWYFKIVIVPENISLIMLSVTGCWTTWTSWPPIYVLVRRSSLKRTSRPKNIYILTRYRNEFLSLPSQLSTPYQLGSLDCIGMYLYVESVRVTWFSVLWYRNHHISNKVWCQRLMILLSLAAFKSVAVIFLVCHKADVVLKTITCIPILWTLSWAMFFFFFFLHKENSL